MKKFILIFALLTFVSFIGISQTLYWQFANYKVINAGTQLQFDVEVKASVAGTFHRDLQVYFDYNTTAFGSDIATGAISYTTLTLMEDHYSVVNNIVDNTSSKVAIITEADNEGPPGGLPGSSTDFNEITTTYQGLLQFTIDILPGMNAEECGIAFDQALMNGGQYYQSTDPGPPDPYPIKYADVAVYEGDISANKLSTVYGNITYANIGSTPLNDITVKLMSGAVEITSDVTDGSGNYYLSSMDDGAYTLDNTTTKPHGGALACNGLDVILTKRWIGGLYTFTPLQFIAADVNEGGAPDGLDVIMMKRYIGGLSTPAWIAPDYVFEPQSVTVASGIATNDYQSLCSGDVNGSYTP